jgi:hypothetical protein
MGRPTKVTPQIKQAAIELTLQHPNFADLQIAQIISERFALLIAPATINRPCHLTHFSECKNRWLFLVNLKRARDSRIVDAVRFDVATIDGSEMERGRAVPSRGLAADLLGGRDAMRRNADGSVRDRAGRQKFGANTDISTTTYRTISSR